MAFFFKYEIRNQKYEIRMNVKMCRSRETACHVLRDDKFAHVTPHVKRDRFGVCANIRLSLLSLRQAQDRAFYFYLLS